MIFLDRLDAARKLAQALSAYRGTNPLVLAIPRGAVPMGAALAVDRAWRQDERRLCQHFSVAVAFY